jgi:hypothetical protein
VEYEGAAAGDRAGDSVAGAGDADGDGYDDFLVGAKYNSDGGSYAGAAYPVFGSASPASASLSTEMKYRGEAARNYAGVSVAGAGDVDGDHYDDLLVGAYGNQDGGSDAGAAYLIFGQGR